MGNLVNLVGRRFGRWTVTAPARRRTSSGHAYWHCRCACGTETEVRGASLRTGTSTRCRPCADEINLTAIYNGEKPLPMAAAPTIGYSYESRFDGRYFAVLHHTLWRGREGTRRIVGYDNEQDARDAVAFFTARMLRECPPSRVKD